MKSAAGRLKTVHVLKFEDKDDFIEETKAFIKRKKIKAAFFMFLGALRKGGIVSGPKKPVIPPVPLWGSFDGAWEAFGVGSSFLNEKNEPQIHIHSSLGKGSRTKMGCVRKNSEVFIVIEALLFEIAGLKAGKKLDTKTGINSLFLY